MLLGIFLSVVITNTMLTRTMALVSTDLNALTQAMLLGGATFFAATCSQRGSCVQLWMFSVQSAVGTLEMFSTPGTMSGITV